MEKLTTEQKENLANEILELLKEHGLTGEVRIYFNNKCVKGDGTIIDKVYGNEYFDATDDTISMSFEGSFYDVINYNLPELANEVIPKFIALLETYGLFYEQGDAWNLSTYYNDPEAYEEKKEGESHKNPIYIRKDQCPVELEPIKAKWERYEIEHGDEGSCVLGSGFTFKFQGLYYKMPHQGPHQGSISWEATGESQYLFVCETRQYYDANDCVLVSINENDLKEALLDALQKMSATFTDSQKVAAVTANAEDTFGMEMRKIQTELDLKKGFLKGLYENLINGVIDDNYYKQLKKYYSEEIEKLNGQEKILRVTAKDRRIKTAAYTKASINYQSVTTINDLTASALDKLIEKIIVFDDKSLEVYYKFRDETEGIFNA